MKAELALVDGELEDLDLDSSIEVEGTIPLDRELAQPEERIIRYEARLAYGPHQRRRRVLVRSYEADDLETGIDGVEATDVPLLDVPSRLQVAAVKSGALDELLELISRQTEMLLSDARIAARRLATGKALS